MVMAFVVSLSAPVWADAGQKLQDGVKMFVTSPKNIPDSINAEYEAAKFKPFGIIGGTMKGVVMTLIDAGKGLFDVLTFPIDTSGDSGM